MSKFDRDVKNKATPRGVTGTLSHQFLQPFMVASLMSEVDQRQILKSSTEARAAFIRWAQKRPSQQRKIIDILQADVKNESLIKEIQSTASPDFKRSHLVRKEHTHSSVAVKRKIDPKQVEEKLMTILDQIHFLIHGGKFPTLQKPSLEAHLKVCQRTEEMICAARTELETKIPDSEFIPMPELVEKILEILAENDRKIKDMEERFSSQADFYNKKLSRLQGKGDMDMLEIEELNKDKRTLTTKLEELDRFNMSMKKEKENVISNLQSELDTLSEDIKLKDEQLRDMREKLDEAEKSLNEATMMNEKYMKTEMENFEEVALLEDMSEGKHFIIKNNREQIHDDEHVDGHTTTFRRKNSTISVHSDVSRGGREIDISIENSNNDPKRNSNFSDSSGNTQSSSETTKQMTEVSELHKASTTPEQGRHPSRESSILQEHNYEAGARTISRIGDDTEETGQLPTNTTECHGDGTEVEKNVESSSEIPTKNEDRVMSRNDVLTPCSNELPHLFSSARSVSNLSKVSHCSSRRSSISFVNKVQASTQHQSDGTVVINNYYNVNTYYIQNAEDLRIIENQFRKHTN